MKAFFLILLVLGSQLSSISQDRKMDSTAVKYAHQRWFDGILAEDTATLSAVLSTDITLGFPGGNIMPRADFFHLLQSAQLFYDSAEHHNQSIRVLGNAAIITGRSTLAYRYKDAPGSERLAYTAVYIRFQKGWQMVAWQSTIAKTDWRLK